MARKSFSLDHFRVFVKLFDARRLTSESFGSAIDIGASGVRQRMMEFRQRGWISEGPIADVKITAEGRTALEGDEAPPLDRSLARGRSKTDPPDPKDLRAILSAPPAAICTLRRAHVRPWGPSFLAELAYEPVPQPPKRNSGEAPKPRDLIDLLDLPSELVAAVLHVLAFPWGDRLLERIELEPPSPKAASGPAAATGGGRPASPPRTGRAPKAPEPAAPLPTPSDATKEDPSAHFNVVDRAGSVRSAHADLGEAKRAMLRDSKGLKVIRRADGKTMATKDKAR